MTGDINFKEIFLNEIDKNYTSEETEAYKKQYEVFFNNTILQIKENGYGKDLYDFTEKEIKDFLHDLNVNSLNALTPYLAYIKKYLNYAQDKKVSIQNVSSAINIKRKDLRELVNYAGEYEKYMTKEELRESLNQINKNGSPIIKNEQEKVIFVLLFNGVKGKDSEDLINLKISHFKFYERTISLDDKKIYLEEWEAEVIQNAINEENFISEDGFEYSYEPSDYILKAVTKKSKKEDILSKDTRISKNTISRRVSMMAIAMGKPFWKPKTILDSGIVYRMLKEKKSWGYQDLVDYMKDNKIAINYSNIRRIMELLINKIEAEEFCLDEIAVTHK